MGTIKARRGRTSKIPSLNIDLYRPEIWDDPWPTLEVIREAGAIVWNERGFWMSAHDRICRKFMIDPRRASQEGMITAFFGPEAFISIDDITLHNAMRKVWVSAFGQDGVAKLIPFVRQVVNDMLDDIEGDLRNGKEVDLMTSLCRPLPAYVIAHMLGVSKKMIPSVIHWSDLMGAATTGGFPINYDNDPAWLAGERAKNELATFLRELIRSRRAAPGDDLISALIHSDIGVTLSEHALMINARQLLFAGNETTAKWLGHALVTFGTKPDVLAKLDADRTLIRPAAEEVLRWQGVTHALPRNIMADEEVNGIKLKKGEEILLLLGAAGRDPERYKNAGKFVLDRNGGQHLGFGFGLHSCLGAVLARMEVDQVISVLLDRFPKFIVHGPVFYSGFSLRGPTAVCASIPRIG